MRPAREVFDTIFVQPYPGRGRWPPLAGRHLRVSSTLHDNSLYPEDVQEVSELQSALGRVAADAGLCIVAGSVRGGATLRRLVAACRG